MPAQWILLIKEPFYDLRNISHSKRRARKPFY
jgi:hypothetical protein